MAAPTHHQVEPKYAPPRTFIHIVFLLVAILVCPARSFVTKTTTATIIRRTISSSSLSLLSSPDATRFVSKSVIDHVSSSSTTSVRKKSRKGKVIIAADLATAVGMPLSQAERELATLASLIATQTQMSVTDSGDILYSFPTDVRSILLQHNLRYRIKYVAQQTIWPRLYYGIRVGFGVALLASIVATFCTLTAIASAGANASDQDENRNNRGMRGGGGMRINLFGPSLWGPSPFNFLYYRPRGYGYHTGAKGRIINASPSSAQIGTIPRQQQQQQQGGSGPAAETDTDLSFLESIFSYVFGDGNPNAGLAEVRLQSAASFVRSAGGAVTAEQLAVFLPEVPSLALSLVGGEKDGQDSAEHAYVDESYVLPLVLSLGGEPTVTQDGEIVYVFTELLKSASLSAPIPLNVQRQRLRDGTNSDSALEEKELEFSIATDTQKTLAFGLGILNLVGALSLRTILSKNPYLKLSGWFGLVQRGTPLLLSYAVLYNVIPLARYATIQRENGRIRTRNSKRQRLVTALRSTGGKLSQKLRAARRFGLEVRRVDDEPIVFDTEMDPLERDRRLAEDEQGDFDRRLL